jgi:hypothetical protein
VSKDFPFEAHLKDQQFIDRRNESKAKKDDDKITEILNKEYTG